MNGQLQQSINDKQWVNEKGSRRIASQAPYVLVFKFINY